MSGHSKWATIKRKKEATDAKRSNMYAKLLRAVEVAAREGGGNVEGNMTLASAVEKAKSFSVPNDNIERAIKRGHRRARRRRPVRGARLRGLRAGRHRAADRGPHRQPQPHGQEVATPSRATAATSVSPAASHGSSTRKGLIVVDKAVAPDEERLLELALEAGAEDLRDAESSWEIVTDAAGDFKTVQRGLKRPASRSTSAELTMLPQRRSRWTAARPSRC